MCKCFSHSFMVTRSIKQIGPNNKNKTTILPHVEGTREVNAIINYTQYPLVNNFIYFL